MVKISPDSNEVKCCFAKIIRVYGILSLLIESFFVILRPIYKTRKQDTKIWDFLF